MIDYFKAHINVQNNKRLSQLEADGVFFKVVNEIDPYTEEKIKEAYLYENFYIRPTKNGLLIQGSLHKYRSRIKGIAQAWQIEKYQGFNGDLFTLKDINEALTDLCNVIGFAPSLAVLQNIEIGVNCNVSFDPHEFLKGMLFHKGNRDFTVKHEGNYIQFDYAQYFLKLYNKGRQYNLPTYILRTEIKVMKMQKLHKVGINLVTLADINEYTLAQAFELLFKEFEEVTYYDYTLDFERLPPAKQDKAVKYQNKEFWRALEVSNKRRLKQHHKEQLEAMIHEFSTNLKGQIQAQMIEAKNNILQPLKNENMLQNYHPSQMLKNQPTDHKGKNEKMLQSYSLSKGELCNIPPLLNLLFPTVKIDVEKSTFSSFETHDLETKKTDLKKTKKGFQVKKEKTGLKEKSDRPKNEGHRCAITGLSLELEREGAKYIQTPTIKFLKEFDKGKYIYLCSYLLPHTGKVPAFEKNIITHLAKQIRNRYRFRQSVEGLSLDGQLEFDFFSNEPTPAPVTLQPLKHDKNNNHKQEAHDTPTAKVKTL